MRDTLGVIASWQAAGTRLALATVVNTTSSTPLPVGSLMAISETGMVHGSVSGGCVEADVIEAAQSVLADGLPRLRSYGVSDADAMDVGLTCGGTIEVLISALEVGARRLEAAQLTLATQRPVAIALPMPPEAGGPAARHEPAILELGTDLETVLVEGSGREIRSPVVADLLRRGQAGMVTQADMHSPELGSAFLQVFSVPRRLIVFGVSSFAVATARLGHFLGFHVTVCDPRGALLTRDRFREPDELVMDWPHRYLEGVTLDHDSVLCVLTHDEKYDLPLLERALASEAGYVGAIGSRRTDEQRRQRLAERGVPDAHIARLRSPVGLDVGGRTAEEVAVAILAEVLMVREGRSGRPLVSGSGPLHSNVPAEERGGLEPSSA